MHTVYVLLSSNYKRDDDMDLLPEQLWKYKMTCLVPWQNAISMASLRNQHDVIAASVTDL